MHHSIVLDVKSVIFVTVFDVIGINGSKLPGITDEFIEYVKLF